MPDRVWAVLPAAGIGQRMATSTPKQYLPLAGMPMVQRALLAIAASELCEGIVLVLAPGDQRFAAEVLPQLDPTLREQLQFAEGGADRAASVLAGVEQLASMAAADDWVLVHDVARPLVDARDVRRLHQQVSCEPSGSYAGGILAARLHDTIKRANRSASDGVEIVHSEDRELLWAAQTPQLFRLELLRKALRSAVDEGVVVTDEAMAVERLGKRVLLVPASAANPKLTTGQDLALAEYLLEARAEEC